MALDLRTPPTERAIAAQRCAEYEAAQGVVGPPPDDLQSVELQFDLQEFNRSLEELTRLIRQCTAAIQHAQGPIVNSTKRPLNHCYSCGHTWYPKGRDVAFRCPRCRSAHVGLFSPAKMTSPTTYPLVENSSASQLMLDWSSVPQPAPFTASVMQPIATSLLRWHVIGLAAAILATLGLAMYIIVTIRELGPKAGSAPSVTPSVAPSLTPTPERSKMPKRHRHHRRTGE